MISPITFLLQVKDELQKVTWPTKEEVLRLTIVVILFSLIIGLFIGGLDFTFTSILNALLGR